MLTLIKNIGFAIIALILLVVLFITIILVMWITGQIVMAVIYDLKNKEDK